MGKTKIEWATDVWNPVTGCTKVSEGCRNCYAKTFTDRFEGTQGHYFESGFNITLRPDKMDQPLRWTRPRRIFVNSMSDLFHPDVPDEYIDQVFAVMALSPQHTFQVLTKRPERMQAYLNAKGRDEAIGQTAMQLYEEFGGYGDCGLAAGLIHGPGIISNHSPAAHPAAWPLPNVWLGVSVENQQAADERIPLLLKTPAAVRFLSCEPLLGAVDLNRIVLKTSDAPERGKPPVSISALSGWYGGADNPAKIDWVIVGGESGSKARPMHPWWVQELRDQCQAAGVSFFFKQWGEWTEADCGNYEVGKHQLHAMDRTGSDHMKTPHELLPNDSTLLAKIGKKATGRELDGRTWDEYPEGAKP